MRGFSRTLFGTLVFILRLGGEEAEEALALVVQSFFDPGKRSILREREESSSTAVYIYIERERKRRDDICVAAVSSSTISSLFSIVVVV